MNQVVVLLSGGLDSAVLAASLARENTVIGLSVRYGQRHQRELQSATKLAVWLGVRHEIVDLSLGRMSTTSCLTNHRLPVPRGHYAALAMRDTVVPGRNLLLLSLAAALAADSGAQAIAYAAHSGDHAIYPDCRPEFIEAMRGPLSLCHHEPIQLFTPFSSWSKAAIVREGDRLGVPFAATWTCYEGGDKHCGRCGSCVERREAFRLAGVTDPAEYES